MNQPKLEANHLRPKKVEIAQCDMMPQHTLKHQKAHPSLLDTELLDQVNFTMQTRVLPLTQTIPKTRQLKRQDEQNNFITIVRNNSDKASAQKLGKPSTKKHTGVMREYSKSLALGAQILDKGFVTATHKNFLQQNTDNVFSNNKAFVKFSTYKPKATKYQRYKQRPITQQNHFDYDSNSPIPRPFSDARYRERGSQSPNRNTYQKQERSFCRQSIDGTTAKKRQSMLGQSPPMSTNKKEIKSNKIKQKSCMSISSQAGGHPYLSIANAPDHSHNLSPVAHTTAARSFNTVGNKAIMPSLLSCRVRGSGHRRSLFGRSEQMHNAKVGNSPSPQDGRDKAAVEMYLKGRSFQKKPGTSGNDQYMGSNSVGRRIQSQGPRGCVVLNKDDASDRRLNFLSAFSPRVPDITRTEYLQKKAFLEVNGMMESRLEGTALAIFEHDQPQLSSHRNLGTRYCQNSAYIQQQKNQSDQLNMKNQGTPTRNEQVFNTINNVNTNSYGLNMDGGNLAQDSLDSIMSATQTASAQNNVVNRGAVHTIQYQINQQQRQRVIPPIKQNAVINNIFCSLERPREASLFRNQNHDGTVTHTEESSSYHKKSIASKKQSETLTNRSLHSTNSRPTVVSHEDGLGNLNNGGISDRTAYQLHAFTAQVPPTKVTSVGSHQQVSVLKATPNSSIMQPRLHVLNVDQYDAVSLKSSLRSHRRSSHVGQDAKNHLGVTEEELRLASGGNTYQSLCSDNTFRGKASLINMRKFSVIPDQHAGSPKHTQFKFHQANNRLAINRIKLYDGVKNMEEMGLRGNSSNRGSIITKNTQHLHKTENHMDSSVYAHSLIESLRASKAALASGINQSTSTHNDRGSGYDPNSHNYYNAVSSQGQGKGSPTPDLVSSQNVPGSSQSPHGENQRDYVRVYNASGNGQRALTHHVTKRNKTRQTQAQPLSSVAASSVPPPNAQATPERDVTEENSLDEGKGHDQSRMTEEQLENIAVEQAGDEDLMTDIDSTQYKRKLLRTGAGDRDALGFKPANQLPEMIPGAITPPLQPQGPLKDVVPPLTDEEAKFSTYQFESQMTFKNALANHHGTGIKLSQVTESNSTDHEPLRKAPKARFTPGVFHNLFKISN